jgi:hypothetical protein
MTEQAITVLVINAKLSAKESNTLIREMINDRPGYSHARFAAKDLIKKCKQVENFVGKDVSSASELNGLITESVSLIENNQDAPDGKKFDRQYNKVHMAYKKWTCNQSLWCWFLTLIHCK